MFVLKHLGRRAAEICTFMAVKGRQTPQPNKLNKTFATEGSSAHSFPGHFASWATTCKAVAVLFLCLLSRQQHPLAVSPIPAARSPPRAAESQIQAQLLFIAATFKNYP